MNGIEHKMQWLSLQHRSSLLVPLSLLGSKATQILGGLVGGGGAVGGGGDDLAEGFGADVSGGVDAGEGGLGGFSGQDVTAGIQGHLPVQKGRFRDAADGDKESLAWELPGATRGAVLQGERFQPVLAGQAGEEGSGVEGHIGAGG